MKPTHPGHILMVKTDNFSRLLIARQPVANLLLYTLLFLENDPR